MIHGPDCECVRCRGFEPGNEYGEATYFAKRNTLAVTHGATTEARIRPLAHNHRRRVLRQLRLRSGDLDPVGRGYLDLYVRSLSKLDLMDAYAAEHGWIDEEGDVPGFARFYATVLNSTRLALARLDEHLHRRGIEPSMVAILQGEARRLDP